MVIQTDKNTQWPSIIIGAARGVKGDNIPKMHIICYHLWVCPQYVCYLLINIKLQCVSKSSRILHSLLFQGSIATNSQLPHNTATVGVQWGDKSNNLACRKNCLPLACLGFDVIILNVVGARRGWLCSSRNFPLSVRRIPALQGMTSLSPRDVQYTLLVQIVSSEIQCVLLRVISS